jgi:hypothetical protein
MNKKINNKVLIIILVGLVGIFVITNYLRNNRSTTTVDTDLIHIDTTAISSIIISPTVGNKEKVAFTKQANNWTVKSGDITTDVKEGSIQNEMGEIPINGFIGYSYTNRRKW